MIKPLSLLVSSTALVVGLCSVIAAAGPKVSVKFINNSKRLVVLTTDEFGGNNIQISKDKEISDDNKAIFSMPPKGTSADPCIMMYGVTYVFNMDEDAWMTMKVKLDGKETKAGIKISLKNGIPEATMDDILKKNFNVSLSKRGLLGKSEKNDVVTFNPMK